MSGGKMCRINYGGKYNQLFINSKEYSRDVEIKF